MKPEQIHRQVTPDEVTRLREQHVQLEDAARAVLLTSLKSGGVLRADFITALRTLSQHVRPDSYEVVGRLEVKR